VVTFAAESPLLIPSAKAHTHGRRFFGALKRSSPRINSGAATMTPLLCPKNTKFPLRNSKRDQIKTLPDY
jgi:hypothetical protein